MKVCHSMTLEEAFRTHGEDLARLCLRLMGTRSDADDLVQDVFLAAQKGLLQLREPLAAQAWLRQVAVRKAHRRLRMRRLRRTFGLEDVTSELETLADLSVTPEDRALLGDVYQVLEKISVPARVAWLLRHVEGESLQRVAFLGGYSLATAKRRIAEAERIMEGAFK